MPIFPFTFDDEERRRRIAEQAMATGAFPRGVTPTNPDAPPPVRLPNLPNRPDPRPLPFPSVPSGAMPGRTPGMADELPPPRPLAMPDMSNVRLPEFNPGISRSDEYHGRKDEYMAKTPGRGKSALVGALERFAGGGGLLGAAAGAAEGAIAPRKLRERQFERYERPKIFERFAMEDQETAARREAEKALREDQAARANIANIQSQIESRAAADALNREKLDFEQNEPFNVPQGGTAISRRTGKPLFTSPRRPNASDEEDAISAQIAAEEGTVEEVSQGSLAGRREMLKKHLTPDEKRIVEGGQTSNDSPQTIARALTKWQKIQDDELGSIRRVTGEKRKAAISRRRSGQKTPQSGGISRPRSQFNSSKFPGANFEP